jgi:stalled ribosome rescue protein Dom34
MLDIQALTLNTGAIQTLLISDSLFRINDVTKRKRYVGLVDAVKESGGEVRSLPSFPLLATCVVNVSARLNLAL